MQNELNILIEDIKADYASWTERCAKGELSDINIRMIQEFNESLSVSVGNKYAKIIKDGSVWGFVVAVDNDKKFRKGDILKAASWASPARNAARGNILDGGYTIAWTGPHYL
jgi:hypothetical protein